MVRNLKHSLLKEEPASSYSAVDLNGGTPHKRARVGVLISGTGERPASLRELLNAFGTGDFLCENILLVVVTGTNLQALMDQAKRPCSSAEIVVVISNRPGVQGLKRASLGGIQTRVNMKDTALDADFILHGLSLFVWATQVVDHKLCGSRAEFDSTINTVLEEFGVELVCLAGFMRILTGAFVRKWNGTIECTNQSLAE